MVKKDKNVKIESASKEPCNCKEIEDNWKRAIADYQNLKRRTDQEKIDLVKYANLNLLQEIVPILDNFDGLEKHSDDAGLKITLNHFKDVLKRIGVEELEVLGKPFDASTSDAIELVPGEEKMVMEVTLKGYKYYDKVLRPAQVRVGKGKGKKLS